MSIPSRVTEYPAIGSKRFQPILASAKSLDVNESNTSMVTTDVLPGPEHSTLEGSPTSDERGFMAKRILIVLFFFNCMSLNAADWSTFFGEKNAVAVFRLGESKAETLAAGDAFVVSSHC